MNGAASTSRSSYGVARDGLLVFGSVTAGNAAAYVLHMVASRRLPEAQYGDLYALLAMMSLLAVITSAATLVVVRTSATLHAREQLAALAGFIHWSQSRALAAAAATTLIALVLAAPLASFLHVAQLSDVVAWSVLCGVSMLAPAFQGVLQGVEDFSAFALASLASGVGRALLGVVALLLGLGVAGVIAAQAASAAAACGVAYLALQPRRHAAPERFAPNSRFIAGSVWAVVAMGFGAALASIDVIVAKHFLREDVAGVYSVIALTGKILLFVAGFIPTLLAPKAAAAVARGESALTLLLTALGATLLLCGAGLVVFALAPRPVIASLTGTQYLSGAPYLFRYGLAMTLLAAGNVVVAFQIATHRLSFVAPFGVAVALEVAAWCVWHDSTEEIITVLIAGNALSLLAAAWGIRMRPAQAPPVGTVSRCAS